MWPLIIAGFTILLVLVLLLVGTRWEASRSGLPWSREQTSANQAGVPISTPHQGRTTWWDQNLGIQRSIGLLFVVGGLWHAASPWINGYSNVTAMTISNVAAGLALALVGAAVVILRGAAGLAWIAGAIGVWVLIAPQVIGSARPSLAANEAVWGGVITIALAVLTGFERRFGREDNAAATLGTQP